MQADQVTSDHKDPERAQVGFTAFGAAAARAGASLNKKPLIKDYVAEKMFSLSSLNKGVPFAPILCCFMWSIYPISYLFFAFLSFMGRDFSMNVDLLGTRTKFIDDHITEGVEKKGITQVVIMGAGLDARAVRHPSLQASKSVKTYEIDFPGMLKAKKYLFTEIGCGDCFKGDCPPVYVGTDLSESPETWKRDLTNAGFDPKKPSFWVMEGVTGYLDSNELDICMTAISSLAAKGSCFALTWNGSKGGNAPWAQGIHRCPVDDGGDNFLPKHNWNKVQLWSIGDAVKNYSVKSSIKHSDSSYWFSFHSKTA